MSSSKIFKLNEQDVSTLGLPDLAFAGLPGTGKAIAIQFVVEELGYFAEDVEEHSPRAVECCCERTYWELKSRGFVIVRLTCNDALRYTRIRVNEPAPDFDGTAKLPADYDIENDGSKYDLYDEIVNVLVKERKKR